MKSLLHLSYSLIVLIIAAGAGQAGDKKDVPEEVKVRKPVQRNVTDFKDYLAKASAKDHVVIQPRVTGYITKIAFKEGSEVKAGDLLFEIDARPYEAQLAAAQAKVVKGEAALKYARSAHAQLSEMAKKNPGVVSKKELEHLRAQEEQAAAGLEVDKANFQSALVNLDFTRIRSPIAGKIGRANLTVGNLAKQDESKLTTVVSIDPMHIHFEIEERILERMVRAAREAKEAKSNVKMVLLIALPGEKDFPHRGTIDFVDNQVNPKGGGLLVRGVIANPISKEGVPLFTSGMSVRVRVPTSKPYEALLIPETAIASHPAGKYVFVVGADNKIEVRAITLGPRQDDGLRVVAGGLAKDDLVVVGDLHRIDAGMKVRPKLQE